MTRRLFTNVVGVAVIVRAWPSSMVAFTSDSVSGLIMQVLKASAFKLCLAARSSILSPTFDGLITSWSSKMASCIFQKAAGFWWKAHWLAIAAVIAQG